MKRPRLKIPSLRYLGSDSFLSDYLGYEIERLRFDHSSQAKKSKGWEYVHPPGKPLGANHPCVHLRKETSFPACTRDVETIAALPYLYSKLSAETGGGFSTTNAGLVF